MDLGYEAGDVCNRDGCDGIIEDSEVEGCTCHVHSPCGVCLNMWQYCPKCEWESETYDEALKKELNNRKK